MKSIKLKYILCIALSALVIAGVIFAPLLYFQLIDSSESTKVYTDLQYKDTGESISSFDEYIKLAESDTARFFNTNTTMYASSDNSLDKTVRAEIKNFLLSLCEIEYVSEFSELLGNMNDLMLIECQQISCIGEIDSEPKSSESLYMSYESKFGTLSVIYSLDFKKVYNLYAYFYDGMFNSSSVEYDDMSGAMRKVICSYLECKDIYDFYICTDTNIFCIEYQYGDSVREAEY